MNAEVVRLKKKSINIISQPQINKKNEKAFDKVQQQLKIKTPNKNRRPLKLTANMIINVKPLKVFPVI